MSEILDRAKVEEAFGLMGEYLRDRKAIGEICVYGGSAIMLTFDWRRTTKDVDAIIASEHGLMIAARNHAAKKLGLDESWLNDNVAMYASRNAGENDRRTVGFYPSPMSPNLRVWSASPEYLFAMKVAAMARRGAERDLQDLADIGKALDMETPTQIDEAVRMFFPDFGWPVDLTADDILNEIRSRPAP